MCEIYGFYGFDEKKSCATGTLYWTFVTKQLQAALLIVNDWFCRWCKNRRECINRSERQKWNVIIFERFLYTEFFARLSYVVLYDIVWFLATTRNNLLMHVESNNIRIRSGLLDTIRVFAVRSCAFWRAAYIRVLTGM